MSEIDHVHRDARDEAKRRVIYHDRFSAIVGESVTLLGCFIAIHFGFGYEAILLFILWRTRAINP